MNFRTASTALRLALFFVLVVILANGVAWAAAWLGFPWAAAWLVGTGTGVVLLAPAVRPLVEIERALENMLASRPTGAVSASPWSPFSPLARKINRLVESGYSLGDLRENLRKQVEAAAAQQERNRLARELHDSIKQQLFSIQMSAAAAETRLDGDPENARSALGDVRRSAMEALVEMNALLQQLSPAPLEKVGLAQALRDQCEALQFRTGAEVACDLGALPSNAQMPIGAQESLFRIVQEALSNIARHARAGRVTVRLSSDERAQQLALDICDDGQGFDLNRVAYGSGIASIRERVELLGGQFALDSRPGAGTRLQVRLPLAPPVVEEADGARTQSTPVIGRTVLAGMAGGIALLAALWFPFFVEVMRGYAPTPYPPNLAGSLLGLAAAAALLLLTGWLAGRWVGSGSIPAGAAAGGVAGVTGYGLLGGAFAVIRGASLLLDTGPVHVQPEAEAARILATAFFGIFLATNLQFWVMLLAGTGLGALGGLLAGRGRLALAEERVDRFSFLILTPMLVSSGLAVLFQLLLMPVIEGSYLYTFSQGATAAVPVRLVQSAVLSSLLLPIIFYLLAVWIRGARLRRRLEQGIRLSSAAWEAFFLCAWSGLSAALSLLWLVQISWVPGPTQIIPAPPVAAIVGWGFTLLNAAICAWTARLLAQTRRKMEAAGLKPPSAVLYTVLIVGPLAPALGLAALFIYGMRYWTLVILGVETILLLYLRYRQAGPTPQANRQAKQEAQELAADTGAAWLGMVYGLILPLLPMGSAGAGIIRIVLPMVPSLVHGAADGQVTPGSILADAYLWHWGGFFGLLLLAGMVVGVVLLGVAIRAGTLKKI